MLIFDIIDGVSQGSVICINYLPGVIFTIAIYAKCHRAYDFLQQLECDPWDTMDEGRKLIVDFNIGKTGLASFNRSVNSGSIHVKKLCMRPR